MEEWKDIEGYEGMYMISSLGRVMSYFKLHAVPESDGILKHSKNRHGYLQIYLTKNSKSKYFAVHRLVAKAFIPNPHNLPFVNHLNEIKDDNRVCNLEWCDAKYNTNYGTSIQSRASLQKNRHGSKPVEQYSLNGEYLTTFPSIMEATRVTGIPPRAICATCRGYQHSAFGYKWKYKIVNDGKSQ